MVSRPIDVCHHLETIMTRKDDKGDQPGGGETTWTNTGMERYDLTEDGTRQADLKTAC